jgi:hypothetical protein
MPPLEKDRLLRAMEEIEDGMAVDATSIAMPSFRMR